MQICPVLCSKIVPEVENNIRCFVQLTERQICKQSVLQAGRVLLLLMCGTASANKSLASQ